VLKFISKRLFYGFLVLFGVIVVVFLLFNVLPGDPARMMLGQRADVSSIETINRDLGRDKPLTIQFLMYLNDLSPLSIHDPVNKNSILYLSDEKYPSAVKLFSFSEHRKLVLKYPYLRRSYQTKRKVSEIILEALPETFVLALVSMIFATIFGILIGIISAIKKGTFIDNLSLILTVLGMSGPSFFIGIIIAWVFGYLLSDYTGLNMTGSLFTQDDYGNGEYLDLKNLILPAITLGIRPLAVIVQLTRSSLLDVLTQDYIRTASAKGLSYYRVIFKHALKNALSPVVTAISGWFAGLMAGAVFIEYIFGWKGIGKEIVDALEKYDFPVVMGSVLMVAIIFVMINIIVDILYGLLDPRVRVQ
jgi:peptide/nickel transport system permease protein